ncbi:MAG: tetratricopeptide repeat protein [Gammaproteobacteria bacterium]|nr:tetratricopeptide repeat protein [Gammaproteobacteria bacterium]
MENKRNRLGAFTLLWALALAWPLQGLADPESDYREGLEAYRDRNDIVGAMAPLRRAADAGHVEAQLLLGFILDWSEENEAAVSYYRMAAETGEPRGQMELARMYLTGEGVDKDPALAREWIEKARAQDHAPAKMQIGYAHLNGAMGYAKDRDKARELFREALAQGHPQAEAGLEAVARSEAAARAADAGSGARQGGEGTKP